MRSALHTQLGEQVVQVPLDGGFRQVHRLRDIAVRQARRHQPQDFPFAMANILIFIETFRVHGELPALLAEQVGQPLPGRGTLGLRFLQLSHIGNSHNASSWNSRR